MVLISGYTLNVVFILWYIHVVSISGFLSFSKQSVCFTPPYLPFFMTADYIIMAKNVTLFCYSLPVIYMYTILPQCTLVPCKDDLSWKVPPCQKTCFNWSLRLSHVSTMGLGILHENVLSLDFDKAWPVTTLCHRLLHFTCMEAITPLLAKNSKMKPVA